MPVVALPVHLLLQRVQTPLDRDALLARLAQMGCNVEDFTTLRRFRCLRCANLIEVLPDEPDPGVCDRCGTRFDERPQDVQPAGESPVVRVELQPVRPDMFEPGGLARALRGILGEETGQPRYALLPAKVAVQVDPRVLSADCPRPHIACAVVRGIDFDDDLIKILMKLQENLHWAMGRDRKHASIGVYDLDTVAPDLRYTTIAPDDVGFAPLGAPGDEPQYRLSPRRILAEHPKGTAYARLLEPFRVYPLLVDSADVVLSMPPIINSERTRVRPETRNLFIDVTGTGERIVQKTLNVLVASLFELVPGLQVEQVDIRYPERTARTPDFTPQVLTIDKTAVERVLGIPLTRDQVAMYLERMRHDVAPLDATALQVAVPAYRNDILHPVDLAEDVGIAYGYGNIRPLLEASMTFGRELPVVTVSRVAREALTGLGFHEMMGLELTSPEVAFDALGLDVPPDVVRIQNPKSVDQTIVRRSLLPGLMTTFADSASEELPLCLFETGDICRLAPGSETGAVEVRQLAIGVLGPRADFALIKATVQAVLAEFGATLSVTACENPTFIPGRGATLYAEVGGEKRPIGVAGEVHPATLERFRLVQPAVLAELDLEALTGIERRLED